MHPTLSECQGLWSQFISTRIIQINIEAFFSIHRELQDYDSVHFFFVIIVCNVPVVLVCRVSCANSKWARFSARQYFDAKENTLAYRSSYYKDINMTLFGQEPWSSGYVMRLMWVRIPPLYTRILDGHFFTYLYHDLDWVFENWANPGLFLFIFGLFKQIFTENCRL